MNILEEVQTYVADKLNADPQLSACPFLVENRKDIDFEIKQALGKQGVVGLVMTPKATYAGAYMDVGIAWQIDELEIDVVENVTVNRGKRDGYITGQDAAMRLFDVLCPLSGENEGQFSPVSYEEGEDNSLLVNKAVLKCLVHPDIPKSKYTYAVLDGQLLSALYEGTLTKSMVQAFAPSSYTNITDISVGTGIDSLSAYCFSIGQNLSSVVLPDTITEIGDGAFYMCKGLRSVQMKEGISSIGQDCFFVCEALRTLEIPSTVQTIGRMAFKVTNDPYGQELSSITFKGKTLAQVQSMENYPWGIRDTSIIHNIIGPDTIVKYAWSTNWDSFTLSGTLNSDDLPSKDGINYVGIGSSIDEIGERAFRGMEFLIGVEIPNTVTLIGAQAFSGAEGMPDIEIPSSVSSIGSDAFYGCHSLSSVMFDGKTIEQVQAMDNYPWGISDTSIISAELG